MTVFMVRFDCDECGVFCERPLSDYSTPGQTSKRYCGSNCRKAAVRNEPRSAGRPCDACGDERACRANGLALCQRCRAVWWGSCRRKSRYAETDAAEEAMQRWDSDRPVTPYDCPICLGVHLTSHANVPPPSWEEDKHRIAAAARRVEAETGQLVGHPQRRCP